MTIHLPVIGDGVPQTMNGAPPRAAPVARRGTSWLLAGAALTFAGACSDGGDTRVPMAPSSVNSPASMAPVDPRHGVFSGEAVSEELFRSAEALVTVDGIAWIHLETPRVEGNPPEATLFVGVVAFLDHAVSGDGLVIGLHCAPPEPNAHCEQPGPAVLDLAVAADGAVSGTLQVADPEAGDRTWTLQLGRWDSYYDRGANLAGLTSAYRDERAPFADPGGVTLEIDAAGRLTVSPDDSGCAGSGALAPHLDGRYDVYDVRLAITGCTGGWSYLNGDFEGSAATTPSSPWDYGWVVYFYLTAPEGPAPRPALSLLAVPRHDS